MQIILTACLLCITSLVAADDWPTWQHDNRRTGATAEALDVEALNLDWTWESSAPPQTAWAGPAKYDAYAYHRNLPSMRNYDAVLHLVAAGDRIWFGSSVDDTVRCLNARDGSTVWSFTTDGPVRLAPTWKEGRLWFGSDDGFARCVDANNGKLIWKYSPLESKELVLNNGRFIPFQPCRTGVVVDDGTAWFACAMLPWKDSWLCAVDAATGKISSDDHFRKTLPGRTMEGAPALSSGALILPQGRVAPRVFDRFTGEDLGDMAKSGGGSVVVVTLDDNVLHGPATDSRKGGFRKSSGESREMVAALGRGNALVVDGATSWMLTDSNIICTNLTNQKTVFTAGCDCPFAMIKAGDTLFVGGDRKIAAHSAKDGQLLWSRPVQGRIFGLVAASGRLFASSDTGVIHCFSANGTSDTEPEDLASSPKKTPSFKRIDAISDERLLGHWAFQSASSTGNRIDALHGSNLTLAGPARFSNVGEFQAVEFDGEKESAMVTPTFHDAPHPTKDFTAEAWVRIDQLQEWGGIVGIIQDNGNYEKGWLLGYRKDRLSLAVNGTGGTDRLSYVKAEQPFELGEWNHVVGTYDGKAIKLFVNGQLAGESSDQSGEIAYPDRAWFEIGAYHDKDEYFRLKGALHEVRLYGAALTAEEIAEQFAATKDRFPKTPEKATLASGPWLQFTDASTALVRWTTTTPQATQVEYGEKHFEHQVSDETQRTEHSATLTGLRHNGVYKYRIKSEHNGAVAYSDEFECDNFFNFSLPDTTDQPHGASRGSQPGQRGTTGASARRLIDSLPSPGRVEEEERRRGEGLTRGRPSPGRSAERRSTATLPLKREGEEDLIARRKEAAEILQRVDVDRGLCLIPGAVDVDLLTKLCRSSQLRFLVAVNDDEQVSDLRRELLERGVYGHRVTVHPADPAALPFPTHWADMVLVPESATQDVINEAMRQARPDGGIVLTKATMSDELSTAFEETGATGDNIWLKWTAPPLVGAGEWSHIYGMPDNSAFGGEQLAGVNSSDDLEVQWIGRPGPRYQADRSGRKPSPLSAGGRLFLQGLHRIIAVNAFNGTILWSLEIPGLERFNMPRDCSNWCCNRDFVFAAVKKECWKIDARTGEVVERIPADQHSGDSFDWGFIATDDDRLYGSNVRTGTSWTSFWGGGDEGWYDARSGTVTHPICSDSLFCRDVETAELDWEYQRGVVLNQTITIGGDTMYFVECRDETILKSDERRIGDPKLWKDLHLVAIDSKTGSPKWEKPLEEMKPQVVLWLAHAAKQLTLVSSSDKTYRISSLNDYDGSERWSQATSWPGGKGDHGKAMMKPAIVGDRIFLRPNVLSLKDGRVLPEKMPDGHGCGTYACTADAVFYRAQTVTMWNPGSDTKSDWPRLRPDCWLSTIPASGMLLSPEGGGGCSCGSWMETSIGFIPKVVRRRGQHKK